MKNLSDQLTTTYDRINRIFYHSLNSNYLYHKLRRSMVDIVPFGLKNLAWRLNDAEF